MSAKGAFVVLEGIEGVGKSTQVTFVADWLKARGMTLDCTREPGGTPLAEGIRDLLLNRFDEPVPEQAELLLMFAARAIHLNNRVIPALTDGTWVLCDRFVDATWAYQGAGRGMSSEALQWLEQEVVADHQPDLVIVLDAPVDIALARTQQRAGGPDRFEREEHDFFARVRQMYLARAAANTQRYAVVNADQPLSAVQADIAAVLEVFLDQRATNTL